MNARLHGRNCPGGTGFDFEDLVEEVPVEPDGIFGNDRPFCFYPSEISGPSDGEFLDQNRGFHLAA
jgi:hypothetical protein